MYSMFGSTIAAISTPRGKGGVAVIRISGEEAFSICENFVFPKSKKKLGDIRHASVCLSDITDEDGDLLDEALVSVFHAPHSYTGENTFEITVVNNLRNMMGPHHLTREEDRWVCPGIFYKESNIFHHPDGAGADCHDINSFFYDGYLLMNYGIKD